MKSVKLIAAIFLLNVGMISFLAGQNWSLTGIRGEGPKVTKNLDLSTFEGIGLSINADVYVQQGNSQSVKIEAQQNIIENLKKEVKNGVWKISFDKNVRNHDGVKIWITMKELTSVAVSGSGRVIGENQFQVNGPLSLAVSGSGEIQLDSESESLNGAISGSGDLKLAGKTGKCNINITGSGDVVAFDLYTQETSVRISGSGDASVNVNEILNVSIAGSGDVYYKGNAKVRSKISGSGDVISK